MSSHFNDAGRESVKKQKRLSIGVRVNNILQRASEDSRSKFFLHPGCFYLDKLLCFLHILHEIAHVCKRIAASLQHPDFHTVMTHTLHCDSRLSMQALQGKPDENSASAMSLIQDYRCLLLDIPLRLFCLQIDCTSVIALYVVGKCFVCCLVICTIVLDEITRRILGNS